MVASSGFFPGFIDSDGRPWNYLGRPAKDYQQGLESALKIALLTHHHLHVPAGYFLDNPHLQRLFLRYRGDDTESLSFRLLMRDLIRVSPNRNGFRGLTKITDWRPVLQTWISGDGSHRKNNVYLNCIDHSTALDIQTSKTTDDFADKMQMALEAKWRIDFSQFLDVCNSLELRVAIHGDFPFDELVRTQLLTGDERFFDFRDSLEEKVNAIAAETARCNIGLSRSLLRNQDFCREIGVPDHMTLTPAEYERLAPILAHYHHSAFATSLSLTGIASNRMPILESNAKQILSDQLEASARSLPVSWPLSRISFENIWQLRMKRNDFTEHLDRIHDATLAGSEDEYSNALHQFGRHVATILSLDFSDANPKELASGLDGSVFAEGTSAKALAEVARFAMTFCRDFFPNIGKELQIRWVFRRLDSMHTECRTKR